MPPLNWEGQLGWHGLKHLREMNLLLLQMIFVEMVRLDIALDKLHVEEVVGWLDA